MKKLFLLLSVSLASVMIPQLSMAQTYPSADYNDGTKVLTITTDQPGTLTSGLVSSYQTAETIVLVGKFNSADLDVIGSNQGFNSVKTVNMAGAAFERNNGSSNSYSLFNNSGEPSANYPQLGQKALTGGSLYKLSVTTSKSWGDPISEPASLDGVQTFNDEPAMQGAANNLSGGTIGRYPSGEYHYYKMNVNKNWVELLTNPGDVVFSYVDPQYSSTNQPPTDGYSADEYIRFPTAGNYYELIVTKNWAEQVIYNPDNYTFVDIDWAENTREQHLGYDINTYIKFETYVYYEYIEGPEAWEHALRGPVDEPTGSVNVFTYDSYDQAYNARWNNSGNPQIGDYARVKKVTYYKMVEQSREWQTPVANTSSPKIPSFAEDQRDNHKSDYENGDVIMFPSAYAYYQLNETRTWSGPSTSEYPNIDVVVVTEHDNISESEINSHYEDSWVGKQLRFDVFSYHVLTETQNRSWGEPIAYNDGRQETILHLYADNAERDADNTASHDDYAVVGATEYVYKTSGWSTDLTPEPDYSAMKFTNWSSTLQTAVLPNNVTVADCPNNMFKGCNALTEVKHNVNNVEKSAKITIETGKVIVNKAEEAGLFKLLVNSDPYMFGNEGTERFADGTVFVFSNGCSQLSGTDLAGLAGNMKDANNDVKLNKFYVDLFDVPVASPSTIETAINDAISIMREKDWQYKGLLFPGNLSSASTQVIKGRENPYDVNKATCSEFVAYNKNDNTITTMHIYNSDKTKTSDYQAHFNKLKSIMDTHSAIADNTTSYLVSTNSPSEINTSSLPTTNSDVILAVNDDMVNPVEGAKADVFVTLSAVGHFATLVANTGIKDTPVDKLTINGEVNSDDISAVNAYVDGPRVLYLTGAVPTETIDNGASDGFDDEVMLETLTNNKIEFIVLPSGKSKDAVCGASYSNSLTSLKAVISSNTIEDTNPALVAYVKVAGSLAEARCLATGSSGDAGPTPQHLSSVTLAGRLRNTDISTSNGNGLANEKRYVQTLDLGDAVFVNDNDEITPTEMNFWRAGFSGNVTGETPEIVLTKVILPTHEEMDELAYNCFYEMKSLSELCIPYNYKVLHAGALNETALDHITTTSGYNGVLVDNGPKTYTLSANLEQIGDEPADRGTALNSTYPVFPKNKGVTDIYSLATKVPVCYKGAFGMDQTTGYGGQDQTKLYCRERYYNNGEADKPFAVLHIPSEESFNNSSVREDDYKTMEECYTDITKKYTKLDQTGAVDADGDPLRWPTHLEMKRVFDQASSGLLWDAWSEGTDTDPEGFKVKDGPTGSEPNENVSTSFYNYIGWHQIVLCVTSYVKPHETPNENKELVYEYEQPGWYTFCIPYNLTYSQVLKMMGVPKSDTAYDPKTGLKVINKVNDSEVTKNMMPDIRQLHEVVRRKGSGNDANQVIFRLTPNLFQGSKTTSPNSKVTQYLDFTENSDGKHSSDNYVDAGGSADDPICLVGGRPYYIKPYLPEGVTPSKNNLGMYIMTRYADVLGLEHSCVDNGDDYCEQLEIFEYDNDRKVTGVKVITEESSDADKKAKNTMRFAKPYEKHKVQAVTDDQSNPGQLVYTAETKNRSTATYRYYYTMVGQFWEQDLPEYCFYMSGQQWSRYTDVTKKWKWAPYKCVILATPEVLSESDVEEKEITSAFINTAATTVPVEQQPANTPTALGSNYSFDHFGGGFRNIGLCYFPMNMPNTTNWLLNPFSLCFFGRNDYSFVNDQCVGSSNQNNQNSETRATRYIFSFDGDENIVELDGQDNGATTIETLDGAPQFMTNDMKVYNLSGQYVGQSTEGLPKGIYIVGGRKIVVD